MNENDPLQNKSITPMRANEFIERFSPPLQVPVGRLEVICGPMYSGKTDELLRRVSRAEIAGKKVLVFTPSTDTRSGEDQIRSHNGISRHAITIPGGGCLCDRHSIREIRDCIIAIDEVQFFHPVAILDDIQNLIEQGCTVIVAGLDMTYRCEPFEPLPNLLAVADSVTKLSAICHKCGADAIFTQRLTDGKPAPFAGETVQVGGLDSYEARCRNCFERA